MSTPSIGDRARQARGADKVESFVPHDEELPTIETLLEELSDEREAAARAELAGDLVRETSLLMDTEDHVLVEVLEEHQLAGNAERLRESIERVRASMEPVYEATHRSAPIEVHQSEPEAFERDLATFESAIHAHLSLERTELAKLQRTLTPGECNELAGRLEAAWTTAIPEPRPPHHGVARRWARLMAYLDRADTGTQYRPARERRRTRSEGQVERSKLRP